MIERLSASTDARLDRVGGKSAGLVRLLAAGLEVPEAWVIPAPVSLDDVQRRQCLGSELAAWWQEASQLFPTSTWAVRSSAVAEDLEGTSFAGIYETVLGVDSLAGVRAAVEQAWSAVHGDRATTYLDEHGIEGGSGIALVLQRMIAADTAGVMLTENPLRPFDDAVVIDASWGLGEAVVSGRTDPDHLILERSSGALLSQRIGAKAVEIVYDGQLTERAVAPDRAAEPCLADTDLKQLWELASLVGERIGERRDLEWAIEDGRLYVLQDRPITGLPPRSPVSVWTRRFGDEYLAEYVSRLGHDLMMPWLTGPQMAEVAELQGRRDLVGLDKLLRHDGHMYLNGDYALALAEGLPRDVRAPLVSWFDPIFARRIQDAPYRPVLLLRALRAPGKDRGRGKAADNLAALPRHCARIDQELVPQLRQDYTALDQAEWRRQLDLVDQLGRDHFRVIRWGMGHHGPLLQGALVKLLDRWGVSDPDAQLQTLLSGLSGTMTAAINRDIWQLASTARQDPALLAALRGPQEYADLRAATSGSPFWQGFDDFVAAHGHRSSSREIAAERWVERPDVVLGLIRAQVRVDVVGESPMAFEARAEARRTELEAELRARIGRGLGGRLRRRIFDTVLGRAQAFTVYRENQRYHLDYLLCHLRLLVLEQGRRLVASGVLDDPSDAFLLSGERFVALAEADEPDRPALAVAVRAEVEEARAHRDRHSARIPAAYLFDGVPTEGLVEALVEAADGVLVGLGASAGQAAGPVRVVRSLADLAGVESGDVLVASNIDPGWTSVFPLLAGLVTETGGILSHGAILAREYGVPTVTCVDAALEQLAPGAVVRVDGSLGTVEPLDAIGPSR